MGLPATVKEKVINRSSPGFSYDEVRAIERKLLKMATAIERKDKAEIYLEDAYGFAPAAQYWEYILDGDPTNWWKLYFEFIHYLQMNGWWPENDMPGWIPTETTIPGYRVKVVVHAISMDNTDGEIVLETIEGMNLWTSQIYLDYPSAKMLADEIGEHSASIESDRMNIRNIMSKGK